MVDGTRIAALAGKGLAVVLAVLVVSSGVVGGLVAGGVLSVGRPTIEEVNTSWGDVTDSSTELNAEVVVDNPNFVAVPEVLDVEYRAQMNDVVVAEDTVEGIGLERGQAEIDVTAEIDNDEMVDWWITHVNNGGTTDLAVTATVRGPGGLSRTYPVTDRTIEPNLLQALEGDRNEGFVVRGQQVAVIQQTAVEWAGADESTTRLRVTATVENTADVSVSVRNLRYFVGFNGITMGSGYAPEAYTVGPGETRTLTFTMELRTDHVDEWWVSHVRNEETTQVYTDVSVTVTAYGESTTFDVRSLSASNTVRTNFVVDRDE